MERSLIWASLALGCFGWLCATVLAAPGAQHQDEEQRTATPLRPTLSRAWLVLAVVIPFAVWVATLPSHPPFSPGQGWGHGFLMGGLGALAGAIAIFFAAAYPSTLRPLSQRAAASAPLFAVLPVVGAALLWMRPSVIDTLSGIATGWLVVSFILSFAFSHDTEPDVSTPVAPVARWLLHSAAFAVTLCAVTTLGVYRDFIVADTVRGTHPAIALALATTVPFALLCSALIWQIMGPFVKSGSSFLNESGFNAVTASIVLLALVFLLSTRVLDEPRLVFTVATGLAASLLMTWMVHQNAAKSPASTDATGASATGAAPTADLPAGVPPLAAIIALCAFMLSYQMLQGFGVGLMALALWPLALLVRRNSLYGLTPLLVFVILLLMSRVFAMRWRADLRGAFIADHYALFGLLLGATLPAMVAGVVTGTAHSGLSSPPSPLRFLLAVGLAIAAPGAMIVLWGTKGTPALCIGLAIAVMVLPYLSSSGNTASINNTAAQAAYSGLMITCFFALFIALAVTQWIHHLLPLSEASRDERLRFLLWGAAVLIVLLLLSDYGERFISWMRRKQLPATSA